MRNAATLLTFCLSLAACAPANQTDYAPFEVPAEADESATEEPEPQRGENDVVMDAWQLNPLPHREPSFPYLEGEDQTVSRSIGNVSFGHLVSARAMQYPHPRISMLRVHASRDLIYTSDQMATLIEDASKHVATKFEGTITYVGNFSAAGGGDIPYSVSHNNGRDADVAFYVMDEKGDPVEPPDLLPLDENGTYTSEDGLVVHFDTPRNWAFIEGVIENGSGVIQLVLISTPLKKMLIEYAEENNANPKTIATAKSILIQPSGALPHDDHFHLRIHCSEIDVASGCVNGGRKGPGYASYSGARKKAIEHARSSLSEDDPTQRAVGIRRLVLLRDRSSAKRIEDKLKNDPSIVVRAAAARALGDLRKGSGTLAKQLKKEEDGHVSSEIIWALAENKGRTSTKALSKFLKAPHVRSFSTIDASDLRMVAADALIDFESKTPVEPLIALAASDDQDLADRAHRALTFLTNIDVTKKRKDPPPKKSKKKKRKKKKKKKKKSAKKTKAEQKELTRAEKWELWWKKNKRKTRTAWVVDGFRASGFDVTKNNIKNVWDICRAIMGPDYVSYNAQRTLMKMTRRKVDSLSWSKEDASFNWRRWVERRVKKLRAPKVPEELSTLQPAPKK